MSTVNFQQEPRWIRWGHKRKPNVVVLKIYDLFDILGDFKPMFRVFFQWIGRTAMATWEWLGRSIMILVNLVLMCGIIYLSVHHSYQLCVWVGYSGIDAWVAVGVFETIFVYCSQVIQNSFKRGKKQGVMPWIGFLAGFAFVVTSNYMGMADYRLAKIIGISLPCLLLIMKGVLAYQFRQARKEVQTKKENPIKKKKTHWWDRLLFWRKPITNEEATSTTNATGEKITTSGSGEFTTSGENEKSPVPTGDIAHKITSKETTTSQPITSNDFTSEQTTSSPTSKKVTSSTTTTSKKNTGRKTTSKKNTSAGGTVVSIKDKDKEIARIVEIAKAIIKKEGDCGRPRLVKEANCKENHARRALKIIEELKEKGLLEIGPSPAGENKSPASPGKKGEAKSPAESPVAGSETKSPEKQSAPTGEMESLLSTGDNTSPAVEITSEKKIHQ